MSHRRKCIQPAGAGGNIRRFAPGTRARSEKQRIELASKLFCIVERPLLSCSHGAVNDENDDEDDRVNGREKFRGESPRDTSRAKILPGIHLGPSSRVVSEGSPPVVTACHVGSLKGQRHPEECSSELVGHPPAGVMAPLTAGRCFRNSPLIRLRAPPLSPGAVCKLHMYPACVRLYKCRGRLHVTRCHG